MGVAVIWRGDGPCPWSSRHPHVIPDLSAVNGWPMLHTIVGADESGHGSARGTRFVGLDAGV